MTRLHSLLKQAIFMVLPSNSILIQEGYRKKLLTVYHELNCGSSQGSSQVTTNSIFSKPTDFWWMQQKNIQAIFFIWVFLVGSGYVTLKLTGCPSMTHPTLFSLCFKKWEPHLTGRTPGPRWCLCARCCWALHVQNHLSHSFLHPSPAWRHWAGRGWSNAGQVPEHPASIGLWK